nr:formate dehydrogenase subunit delta [Nocardioides thalensis]
MINNIAVQFGHLAPERASEEVANHVRKFWDPRMKARLLELATTEAELLQPAAYAAVGLVNGSVSPPQAPATSATLLSVRTADGSLEVDLGDPRSVDGLRSAIGVDSTGRTASDLRGAIEQVTTRWTTAEALLALDQEDVPARAVNGDHGLVAP